VHILLLFLDGFGIGKKDPSVNPMMAAALPTLRTLFGGELPTLRNQHITTNGATIVPANATLGVEGLPQSGTGQTALFCGVNAAKLIGKHFGPYPYSTLKPIIKEKNIFQQFLNRKKKVRFANAYPRQFFDYVRSGKTRFAVTSLSCMMAGIPLLGYDELMRGKAISADITAARWNEFGCDRLPRLTPKEAGTQLYAIALHHDFTMFEYFLPDHAGHAQDMSMAVGVLERFDQMLAGILERFDDNNALLIICSDHGNVEDLSTKTHTLNPVPIIAIGALKDTFTEKIKTLVDVTPTIMSLVDSSIKNEDGIME
jgi:hypothetical protein